MTARWPSGCLYAASSIALRRHAASRLIVPIRIFQTRHYAQKTPPARQQSNLAQLPKPDPVKSALEIIEANAKSDPVNPPASTRPPPLTFPTRGSEALWRYYWNIGRAYLTFYKDGVKAVWYNYKAVKALQQRLTREGRAKDIMEAIAKGVITRSELQLMVRNQHDLGKLPVFGLLVLIFGEWLALIVPFIPNTVPGTCRIPKQVEGMRTKAEERRRISFLQGITEPTSTQFPDDGGRDPKFAWPVAFINEYRREMLANLRSDQLLHLSSTLGLHSTLWDRIQLPPPSSILRNKVNRRLHYLSQDDYLILHNGGAARLSPPELAIACEERGLNILGKRDEESREELAWWLARQQEDSGYGKALLAMLFRRLVMREWVKLNLRANANDGGGVGRVREERSRREVKGSQMAD